MLERAGVARADGLIAVTRFDNANLMAVEIATHLYDVPRTIARLFNPEREDVYRKLGVRYVSGTGTIAKLFLNEFREESFPLHVHFADSDVHLVDLEIDTGGHGTTVEEFEVDGLLRVAAVRRGARVFIPDRTDRLERDDVVTAAMKPSAARALVGPRARPLRPRARRAEEREVYVVIAGGGRIGRYIARDMTEKGHDVTVIERIASRCEELVAETDVLVIEGDACDVQYLEQAHTDRADAFVATTHEDDDNLVACQLARIEFDVKRSISRVNSPKNVEIFEALGIEAVSSTRLISELLENEFSVGELIHLTSLKGGRVGLVELRIPDGRERAGTAHGRGHRPAARGHPRRASSAATRPSSRTARRVIEPGDEVVALTTPELESAPGGRVARCPADGAQPATRPTCRPRSAASALMVGPRRRGGGRRRDDRRRPHPRGALTCCCVPVPTTCG